MTSIFQSIAVRLVAASDIGSRTLRKSPSVGVARHLSLRGAEMIYSLTEIERQ